MNVSVRFRDTTLFPAAVLGPVMDGYIVESEEQLSPVVVTMTGVLLVAFAVGLVYAAVGTVL